jgi:hypothetical protein
MRPFILYHWSPIPRRNSILKYGLCPGKRSRCGCWNPPYICLSKSPSQAWGLSAALSKQNGEWDLWMVWSSSLDGYERLYMGPERNVPTEYRVYHRIKKSLIWYVGSRTHRIRTNAQRTDAIRHEIINTQEKSE